MATAGSLVKARELYCLFNRKLRSSNTSKLWTCFFSRSTSPCTSSISTLSGFNFVRMLSLIYLKTASKHHFTVSTAPLESDESISWRWVSSVYWWQFNPNFWIDVKKQGEKDGSLQDFLGQSRRHQREDSQHKTLNPSNRHFRPIDQENHSVSQSCLCR